jgi:hypothetical protein
LNELSGQLIPTLDVFGQRSGQMAKSDFRFGQRFEILNSEKGAKKG